MGSRVFARPMIQDRAVSAHTVYLAVARAVYCSTYLGARGPTVTAPLVLLQKTLHLWRTRSKPSASSGQRRACECRLE